MSQKRSEETPSVESPRRLEDAGLQLAAMRNLLESANQPEKPAPKEDEKLSLFWRVFGGTILSIIALAVMTLYNNMSSSISELRAELLRANEARMNAVNELRTELGRAKEANADMVRKDEFNTRMTSNWDRIQALQTQNNTQNATMTSLKTEQDGLKERSLKVVADLEGLRKDQAMAMDSLKKEILAISESIKKDVAALEVLRERSAAMVTELKTAREELTKLRGDVDRNLTQDHERRDRRDAQFKTVDETLKELTKSYQETREKLARLETLVTAQVVPIPAPMPPATPKKNPAPKAAKPIELEQAPPPRIWKKN